MSLDLDAIRASSLTVEVEPRRSRSGRYLVGLLILLLAVTGGLKAYESGVNWSELLMFTQRSTQLAFLEADKGSVTVVVNETGSLESESSTTVKCQVEALIGTVGGQYSGSGGMGGRGGMGGGGMGGGGMSGGGMSGGGMSGGGMSSRGGMGGTSKAGASRGGGMSGGGMGGGGGMSGGGGGGGGGMGGGGGGGGGMGGGGGGGGGEMGGSSVTRRPMIRSFSYRVTPHMPLRNSMSGRSGSSMASSGMGGARGGMGGGGGSRGGMSSGGGSRGGGSSGGSRGGGGGGGFGMEERAGSTRIISILPQGKQVKGGDVVCELDSAAFRDELQAQTVKVLQAKAWVDQAQTILDVNEIAYREYMNGIFPQDLLLIRQYLNTCRIEEDRAEQAEKWSLETTKKGYRAQAQYEADRLELERCRIALRDAEVMEQRLLKFTKPKIEDSLKAKLEAIRADKFAQEAAYQLEVDRQKRLERMIANCVLKAPKDGIVVYANQTNSWGRTEAQIEEGVTVREGQPIFELPDPERMRIKARVNESKMAYLKVGQRASVKIDAFPETPLKGTVTDITPIPAPSGGPMSDTRVYFAIVHLDTGGFKELRPGLSAEVTFLIDSNAETTRVPLQAIRWVRDQAFVAVAAPGTEIGWQWKSLSLGLKNSSHAEVLKGVEPGDKLVMNPNELSPAPIDPSLPTSPGAPKSTPAPAAQVTFVPDPS